MRITETRVNVNAVRNRCFLDDKKFCYHVKGELPLEKVNKVQNLIWLCNDCYRMVNNGPIPPDIDEKVLKKIQKYQNM